MPGVVAVFTGADLRDDWRNAAAVRVAGHRRHEEPGALAARDRHEVCFVGRRRRGRGRRDRAAARDAVEAVVVDYDELPVVLDLEAAAADDGARPRRARHEQARTRGSSIPDAAAVDAGVRRTRRTRSMSGTCSSGSSRWRWSHAGCASCPSRTAATSRSTRRRRSRTSSRSCSAITLGIARAPAARRRAGGRRRLRVEAQRVRRGGPVPRAGEASEATGPVDRGAHREHAGDDPGPRHDPGHRARGRRRRPDHRGAGATSSPTWARTSSSSRPGIPLLGAFLYHGVYDVPAYSFSCTGVFTNRTPTDAYRGAGRPEATYAIERAIDALAREGRRRPGRDPPAQLHPPDKFPYDVGRGLDVRQRQLRSRARQGARDGRLRRRAARSRPTGAARARRSTSASASRRTSRCAGSRRAGCSRRSATRPAAGSRRRPRAARPARCRWSPAPRPHGRATRPLVDDRGRPPRRAVRRRRRAALRHRDLAPRPGHLRLAVGRRSAAWRIDARVRQGRRQGAARSRRTRWRLAEDDLEFVDGEFRVGARRRGRWRSRSRVRGVHGAQPARRHGAEPRRPRSTYDPPNFTFPFGMHIAVVEIDEETGHVDLLRYVAVDDCGNQINPLIVEGQVHGGIVQGIAQALWEEAVYDDDGNLRTASLTDYLVPSAAEVPSIELDPTVTPSPTNPLGVKGIGEAGTIAATPAVMNAVVDALAPFGITDIDMPASPQRVWAAITERRTEAPGDPGRVRLRARRIGRRGGRAARRARRRRQAPRRRHVADPAHEAAAGDADGARRRRADARPVVRSRRRRPRRDRRARPATATSRPSDLLARGVRRARGRRRRGRRQPGAPPRHDRRFGRARRSRVGPSGGAARARRHVRRAGPERRAHDRRAPTSSAGSSRPRSRPTSCSPRSASPRRAPTGFSYQKFNRRAQDWAIVGAVAVRMNGGRTGRAREHGHHAAARAARWSRRSRRARRRRRRRARGRRHRAHAATSTRRPSTARTWPACSSAARSKLSEANGCAARRVNVARGAGRRAGRAVRRRRPEAAACARRPPAGRAARSTRRGSGLAPVVVVVSDDRRRRASRPASRSSATRPRSRGSRRACRRRSRALEPRAEVDAVVVGLADQPLVGAEAYRRVAGALR